MFLKKKRGKIEKKGNGFDTFDEFEGKAGSWMKWWKMGLSVCFDRHGWDEVPITHLDRRYNP